VLHHSLRVISRHVPDATDKWSLLPAARNRHLMGQSSSANSSLLSTMQSDISKTSGVASVTPAAVNSAGTTAVFNVIPATRPQATETTALVNTLRDDVLPKEHATSYVTGTTAGAVDFTGVSRADWRG
jgi:enterochelin esterase-like enzyme